MSGFNSEEAKRWIVIEYNQVYDTIDATTFGEMLDRNVDMAVQGKYSTRVPLAMTANRSDVPSLLTHVRAMINSRRNRVNKEELKHMRKLTIPDVESEKTQRDK